MEHVKVVLDQLLDNHLYIKAEKCEFHVPQIASLGYVINAEGVSMAQDKVSAVTTWPTPTTVKELQQFLGFANFYRHFIQSFSTFASPLMALLKKGPKHLQWNPVAETAFAQLKSAFTSAPIFKHPDLMKPFIMEVDTSESWVGAVLLQRFGEKAKLQPVTFFSRKLTPAEQNYDIGNWKLLAIKLA
ncbi:uncharacterized protein LOC132900249 [Neoarius graeffei]|uniref:uncharacterized protein LOC132900249 n=1 Tax=Neoarius graeffei TaxID=443677 RepID=UPI00298CC8C7|nr:uncharacterized protein LOC132900249 [Neoarius graeffei]